ASAVLAPTVLVTPYVSYFVLQRANVALDEKDKKKHHADVMTDRIILCGKQEPGSGEKLIIQTSSMKIIKGMVTDSNGVFDLKSIAKKAGDEIYFNIFIKKEDSIFYLSTIYL
ncbi:MAG: hypothetical protein JRI61_06935, partial [Deltaproteobacteria bacterium]|nr:hypothetical protein [Deltaproteobacteria bacterium]